MRFQLTDIKKVWNHVRQGLQTLCDNPDGMQPEDYYALIVFGRASLLLDNSTGSFVIIQFFESQDAPGESCKVLKIMAAVGNGQKDARVTYLPELELIAQNEGCRWLEHDSTRKGFLKDKDWKLDKMVFRREVPHGEK